MAKNKSEASKPTKSAKTTGSKKPATKPAPPVGESLVDTNLAAQSAARQLVAGLKKATPSPQGTPQGAAPNSKLFEQIKSGQSNSSIMGGVLDKSGSNQNKSNVPFGGKNQKGHNQTFGANVSKTSVPRRTAG